MKKVKLYTVSERIIDVYDHQDSLMYYNPCTIQIEYSNEFVIAENKITVSSTPIKMLRYLDITGKEVVTYYSMHPDVSKLLQIDRMMDTNSELRNSYLQKSKQLDDSIAINKRLDEIILDLNSRLDSSRSDYHKQIIENNIVRMERNQLSKKIAEYNLQQLKISRLTWW